MVNICKCYSAFSKGAEAQKHATDMWLQARAHSLQQSVLSCFSDPPHNFTVKNIPIFNHLDI